jgi:Reverse transcriptase (RNA-dependent DNA polymerase)/Endonuclease-reverse transcriptase
MDFKLRLGQLNCGRSKAATLELGAISNSLNLNILLIQEPYSYNHIISGFGGDCSIFFASDSLQSSNSPNIPPSPPQTAIVVFPKSLKCTLLSNITSTHLTCVTLELPYSISSSQRITLISQYYQFSDSINSHLDALQNALNFIPDGPLLIAADTNARSSLWGPGPTNHKGREFENFLGSNLLYCMNNPESLPTFNGPMGSSHIDVTLSSPDLLSAFSNWVVHDSVSCSDHRLITFDLELNGCILSPSSIQKPFKRSCKSFEIFDGVLNAHLDCMARGLSPDSDPGHYAQVLQDSIINSAESGLGRVSGSPNGRRRITNWWSSELNKLKRLSRAAQSALRFSGRDGCDESRRAFLLDNYRRADYKYKRAIEKAKKSSWRDFVSSQSYFGPWGPAFQVMKVVRKGYRMPSCLKDPRNETFTSSLKETGEVLLNALIREDSESDDSLEHLSLRAGVDSPYSVDAVSEHLEFDEVEDVFRNLRCGKAPGLDRITPEIARRVWRLAKNEIFNLFKACLEGGVFPDCWKAGLLIVFPKPNSSKPLTHPAAYRPITLLPVLGKCLERLIASRLRQSIKFSPNQFGFLPKKSTEDNLHSLVDFVNSSSKHVVAVFLDISCAFDSAWWPLILSRLREKHVPKDLYNIVKSFFSNRSVSLDCETVTLSRSVTIGCPQGSVLGPLLWNILFDSLLERDLPEGCHLLAYADDITLVIEANSREEILSRSESALGILHNWSKFSKLSFSPEKTEVIFLKGILRQPPVLKFRDFTLPFVPSTTHLGVILSNGCRTFRAHVNYIVNKALKSFHFVSRLAGANWGLRFSHLKCLYAAIFVQIVSYSSSLWRDKITGVVRLALHRGQRTPLMMLTRSYRTTSNSALAVIAGVLPLDLQVQVKAAGYCFRNDLVLHIDGVLVPKEPDDTITIFKQRAFDTAIDVWQVRWDVEVNGRHTYSFFPDIRRRLSYTWIVPDRFVSQFLTGHGAFAAKLTQLGLRNDPRCVCGEYQDADHILWSCSLLENERKDLRSGFPPNQPNTNIDLVSSYSAFRSLRKFAEKVCERREILS